MGLNTGLCMGMDFLNKLFKKSVVWNSPSVRGWGGGGAYIRSVTVFMYSTRVIQRAHLVS